MPQTDPYVAHVSRRVVAMFEHYSKNIDAENEDFLTFITECLAKRSVRDPKKIPFSELYRHIKEGIQEYLRQREGQTERTKRG